MDSITSILVFTGLLFTTARIIRGTDNFYFLALLSFIGIIIINYKIMFESKFKKTIIWFLPFGLWAVLSAIWSLEPFVSLARGIFYLFIMLTAVLIGFIYKKKHKELFKIFLTLNTLFIILSFISLISGIPIDAWTANHGMGFTSIFTHQNTLAAVLMFTLIGPVYLLIKSFSFMYGFKPESRDRNHHSESHAERSQSIVSETKVDADIHQHDEREVHHSDDVQYLKEDAEQEHLSMTQRKGASPARLLSLSKYKPEFIFSFLITISNLYFIYLSYSRAVMLAIFIGCLVFIYLLGTLKFNLIFTFALIITLGSIYYLFSEDVTKYLKKGANNYFDRRDILWVPSYQAALNGGIIGLGYGVTDPTIESYYKKENKFGELKREKGNSILALIEEVGIIGLFLFLLPVYKISPVLFFNFRNSKFKILNSKMENHSFSARTSQLPSSFSSTFYLLPFSFLIIFLIHSQFEAWWSGISSLFLFTFLIVISSLFLLLIKNK